MANQKIDFKNVFVFDINFLSLGPRFWILLGLKVCRAACSARRVRALLHFMFGLAYCISLLPPPRNSGICCTAVWAAHRISGIFCPTTLREKSGLSSSSFSKMRVFSPETSIWRQPTTQGISSKRVCGKTIDVAKNARPRNSGIFSSVVRKEKTTTIQYNNKNHW